MAASAVFTGPQGTDPVAAIRGTVETLRTITAGDLLYVGKVFRARIRQRTLAGVDVNGASFAPYSTRGPYYLYVNRGIGASGRERSTAAKNRYLKTKNLGRLFGLDMDPARRTPYGIRYASYAAAKAAHGVTNVNLFGMEEHTHMLDTMLVRVNGAEAGQGLELLGSDEFAIFEQSEPATQMALGFYGEEAARAEGHNEGTSRLPKREFFALNPEDLQLAETAIGERIEARAKARQ